MSWSTTKRWELTWLLSRELADPARMGAVAASAGLSLPPQFGFESAFSRLSRLVLAARAEDKLDELLTAARGAVSPETERLLSELTVDTAAETEYFEPETVRDTEQTVLDGPRDAGGPDETEATVLQPPPAEPSAAPEPPAEPSASADADRAAEPESSAEPEASAQPEPAAEPEPADEPESSGAPESSAEPEPADEPESSAEAEETVLRTPPSHDPPPADEEEELATMPSMPSLDDDSIAAAAPRPVGTPAQAPPIEGATSWLVRRVHLGTPSRVVAGTPFSVDLTLSEAEPGVVATAPADAEAWAGPPVDVEVELWLEEAYAGEGTELHSTLTVAASEPRTEARYALVAADPLAEGVDVTVRFYVSGFEVGRARSFVQNRDRDDVSPRAGTPGALVIPDTILR